MTIEAAIANLQAKALAVSGTKEAPDAPPESNLGFPFSMCFERDGRLEQRSAGFGDDLGTLWLEYHVARGILPVAITTAMAFRDAFLKKIIADPTLSGTVSTVTSVSWVFGAMKYADTETIGYRFMVGCKVQLNV
jgi:hypothetical protein